MFTLPYDKACEIWKENKEPLIIGRKNSRQFLKKLKKLLQCNLTVNQLLMAWKAQYKKETASINLELINFIELLKEKYNLYLFTDTIDIHDKYNSQRNIYNKFTKVFKSYKEKLKKPDKEAYLNVLNKINAKPNECVFIDDLEKNVRAAVRVGVKGIVYKNFKQLKNELGRMGITP